MVAQVHSLVALTQVLTLLWWLEMLAGPRKVVRTLVLMTRSQIRSAGRRRAWRRAWRRAALC